MYLNAILPPSFIKEYWEYYTSSVKIYYSLLLYMNIIIAAGVIYDYYNSYPQSW